MCPTIEFMDTHKFKPTRLSEDALKSGIIASFYVVKKEELFQSLGNQLNMLAVYPDGNVCMTHTTYNVRQIRTDDVKPNLYHILSESGNRELSVVAI